jgi:hypothetical protein
MCWPAVDTNNPKELAMATKKQISANRLNALKSTGPTTQAGKSAVRNNALTHGLLARDVVLSSESSEEFSKFAQRIWAYWTPVGLRQEELVQVLITTSWRLRRCVRIETGTFDKLEGAHACDGDSLAAAFAKGAVLFACIGLYESQLARRYFITVHELERLQAAPQQLLSPVADGIDIEDTVLEQFQAVSEAEEMRRQREKQDRKAQDGKNEVSVE